MRIALPLVALATLVTALPAAAETPQLYEQVYLTKEQALKIALPEGDPVTTRVYDPRPEERKRIERRLGRKVEEGAFTVYQSTSGGKPSGYAMILDEQGKYYPMTFVVGLKPDGSVREVAVMVYRERRGDDVRRRRFLNQFRGKTAEDALMVNRDLIHLTGATVSSWSVAAGVKKAVVVVDEMIDPS